MSGALVAWALGVIAVLAIDDPRLRFLRFLAGVGLATVAWLLISGLAVRGRVGRRAFIAALGLALAARGACLLSAPAFSEDAFRHVYEGRAMLRLGPAFPFQHPPSEAPELGAPPDLLDSAWLRINHPHIATIYPPFAQLVFAAAAELGDLIGGHLFWLKLLLVAADLGTFVAIFVGLGLLGRPREGSLVYLLSPLVILETAREGHADVLGALGLALGVLGFASVRPRLGYFGFALAALAKLHGLIGIAAALRTTRRGAKWALAGLVLLLVPLVLAGPSAASALGTYASSWRSGDGAFTLLLEGAERVLGGDHRWIEALDLTITRHQLARGAAFVLFVGLALWVLRPRAAIEQVPERAGILLLLLLLLSPTLHPWYPLCLLPFIAAVDRGRSAMLALIALSPILHHPAWIELEEGAWREVGWVKALVHVPPWLFLIWSGFGNRVRDREALRADSRWGPDRV